ncbi:ARM repeat superfamily protein [Actinidia rufa]|uniref:ARM repeat superfamily protein n=1 Tax=Actinidia rufa TaxID=165716 RepID=A0A7J0HDT1_9ERIC|nr:ARM repeat superfamily protein [Actinidia rufa]
MADALCVIPASVLRNLSEKLYEKRKNAALELEGIVKQLAAAGDHDKITAVINLLTNEFTYSPQANHRKGGLIGLAAATVGLSSEAAQHLEQIVPPVLNSFSIQDSRVRYYACEALYNIAKVVRGDFIVFFNQIFDALCKLSADSDPNVQSAAHLLDRLVKDIVTESDQFSIEEFIPLLRERMNILNPYVRQFLVGWITVLDSVPDIDMLGFLPDFLDGLFNMLSDSSHEIRQQADSALSEFLQEIKNSPSVDYGRMAEILVQRAPSPDEFTRLTAITWINEFVKLGGHQLVPYYADILGAILPCISDKEEKIRVVARETNEELRAIKADPAEGFDVLSFLNDIFDTLLKALSDPSDEVVLLVLEVHACIAEDPQHFRQLVVFLVHNFRIDNSLLEKRGALIIRRLCVLLDAERVYCELSTILEGESDLDFASLMVQALNLILLTSSELAELRDLLKQSLAYQHTQVPLFNLWLRKISMLNSWFSWTNLSTYWRLQFLHILGCRLSSQPSQVSELFSLYYGMEWQVVVAKHRCYYDTSSNESEAQRSTSPLSRSVKVEPIPRVLGLVFSLDLGVVNEVGEIAGTHKVECPSGLEDSSISNVSAVFSFLQLLEPGRYIWLLKALYGLLMLLPQQSMAFKILRTRLKTVPSYSFTGDQFKWLSGSPYSQIEVGDMDEDLLNAHNGINFASRLQQFEQMQHQHRMNSKSQSQSRYSSNS